MATDRHYIEFNNFQGSFYTDRKMFSKYTNYDCKRFGYILINNMAKGFPNLANIISNLKGFTWSGVESVEVLKALQWKFTNPHLIIRLPTFVFYKNLKPEKSTEKIKVSKKSKTLLDFDDEIKKQIMEILMYDSKTYEYLKYTQKVQDLGKQINGQFVQTKQLKPTTKRQRKSKII